jgi:hypothetical protein
MAARTSPPVDLRRVAVLREGCLKQRPSGGSKSSFSRKMRLDVTTQAPALVPSFSQHKLGEGGRRPDEGG